MRPSRSSLRRIRWPITALSICVASCITSSSSREDELLPYTRAQSFYSPYRKEIQKKCSDNCPDDLLFNFYCSKGKQTRRLTTRFLAVLGPPQPGISIEDAGKVRSEAAATIRAEVAKFYHRGLVSADTRTRELRELRLSGLPVRDFAAVRNGFKDARMVAGASPVLVKTENSNDPIIAGIGRMPLYEVSYGNVLRTKSNLVVVGSIKSECYGRQTPICNLFDSCDHSDRQDRCVNYYGEPLFGFVDAGSLVVHRRIDSSLVKATDHIIYPLRPLIPLETHSFASGYTMLIPPQTQKDLFGGTAFVRTDGTFDLAAAVRDRKRLWSAYIERFSSVKEAQDKDPDVTRYEVTLDLSAFCAYGRPVTDLTTK